MEPVKPFRPRPSSTSSAVVAFFLKASQTQSGKRKSRWLVYTGILKVSGYFLNSAFCPSLSLSAYCSMFCAVMVNSGLSLA
ncbi:hypothetical protein D3C72_2214840 [compost metagenome]